MSVEHEHGLTAFEMEVVNRLYNSTESSVRNILRHPSWGDLLVITKTVAVACGAVELVRVDSEKLSGDSKKAVSVYLGRRLLERLLPSNNKGLLDVYDSNIGDLVEVIIDFAKNNKCLVKNISTCSPLCL